MMALDAARSIETDATKQKIWKVWKVRIFVTIIIFMFFMAGTSILNSQSKKLERSKMEKLAFETYNKYSQQLETITDKN